MWHYTYSWLYWWSKVPGVPNNNLLMLEVHSKIGECFCPAVCSTERHCCPEPWRLKRLNALLLLLLTGRRGWKCGGAAPVVFFVLICCSGGFFVQGCLSVKPTLCCATVWCVSGWLLVQPLLWQSCRVTFCRAEHCDVFWILYVFSNFNVKTQPGCYFWPETERGRRGELSCGDP